MSKAWPGLWALKRYVPIVAADPPAGLMLDATGADHLYGGAEAMLADLLRRLAAIGIAARVAMAGSYGAAHALARFGSAPCLVVPPGGETYAIGPLPLAALRLDADTIASLNRLGFETIAELDATPRPPLAKAIRPLFRALQRAECYHGVSQLQPQWVGVCCFFPKKSNLKWPK